MQHIINEDNDQMFITSDLIESFIDGLPSPGYTLFLKVLYNGTQVLNLELTSLNLDIANDRYVLIPSVLFEDAEIFPDGIYMLTLTEGDNNTSENNCVAILNDLTCRIIAKVASLLENKETNEAANLALFLEILKGSNTCADCNCADALLIYNYLLNILNTDTIINDCGC